MTARLKVARSGQRRPSGSRETTDTFMTVVSVYAPTAKAPSAVKLKFADELQDVLDTVPHSDVLILLGDFNACFGKRDTENSIWSGVIGNLIIDNVNEAVEEFLEFCEIYVPTYHHEHLVQKERHASRHWHRLPCHSLSCSALWS